MTSRRVMPNWVRRTAIAALGAGWAAAAAGGAFAQTVFIDPYKPYTRQYQPFSDPVASARPGFPNPLGVGGRPTYGNFNPFDTASGGLEPLGVPYYNRAVGPMVRGMSSTFNQAAQDNAARPAAPVDPQAYRDLEFFRNQARREQTLAQLQQRRDQYYFAAMRERDPNRRADLYREYTRLNLQLAQASGPTRRSAAAATAVPGRRLPATVASPSPTAPRTAPAPATAPATTPPPAPRALPPPSTAPNPFAAPSPAPGFVRPSSPPAAPAAPSPRPRPSVSAGGLPSTPPVQPSPPRPAAAPDASVDELLRRSREMERTLPRPSTPAAPTPGPDAPGPGA